MGDPDPTLADVLAKLDELQLAVARLHAAVAPAQATPAAPSPRPAAPSVGSAAGALRGGDAVGEEPAAPSPSMASEGGEARSVAPSVVVPESPDTQLDADGADAEPPSPRPSDGPKEVLELLFSAALRESEADSWPYLMALTHSRDLENPRALDYLKAFNWRKLRRSLDRYLVDGDPASFHVVRTDPAEIGDAEYVKVFLHQEGGMPGPVHLRRDPKKGGVWLVAQISL